MLDFEINKEKKRIIAMVASGNANQLELYLNQLNSAQRLAAPQENYALEQVGKPALIEAAKQNHPEVVSILLEVPEIAEQAHVCDNFLLLWAISNGYEHIVARLLTIPAVVKTMVSDLEFLKNYPVRLAAEKNYYGIVGRLLDIPEVAERVAAGESELAASEVPLSIENLEDLSDLFISLALGSAEQEYFAPRKRRNPAAVPAEEEPRIPRKKLCLTAVAVRAEELHALRKRQNSATAVQAGEEPEQEKTESRSFFQAKRRR